MLRRDKITIAATLVFLVVLAGVRFGPAQTNPSDYNRIAATPIEVYRIDINKASVQELQVLEGVGPKLAERIVTYRTQHGKFRSVEDLLSVKGIGESKLKIIEDLIQVS